MSNYSITNLIADPKGVVVALNWVYTNADGSISNQLRLAEPLDVTKITPIGEVTEAVAVTWLEAQLGNTAEEFDAHIAKDKARREAEEASVTYTMGEDGNYSVPDDDEQVVES